MELIQSPEQRAVLDRLVALSTLLEGHADHVMDAVGPVVVPSVATLRTRFTARRKGGGVLDRVLRAVLGVEAKIRQYAEGAAFTRHVVDAVGMNGFNDGVDLTGDAAVPRRDRRPRRLAPPGAALSCPQAAPQQDQFRVAAGRLASGSPPWVGGGWISLRRVRPMRRCRRFALPCAAW